MRFLDRKHLPGFVAVVALALVVGGGALLTSSTASPTSSRGARPVNADTLNGYRANDLTKAVSVRNLNAIDGFDPCTWTTEQTLKVAAPRNGYLMVWATVGAARDTDFPDPAELVARLRLGTRSISAEDATQLTTDGSYDGNVTVQGLAPVKAGIRSIKLQLKECGGSTSAAYVTDRTISAMFTPFGKSTSVPVLKAPAQSNR